ncbi:hypothetical protein [Niabella drilacis]|uniref:Uncharacterized protein n=1 Tax=Niabella drilacis (strain DSM 25811 / CCM 8410 / CCUG 62505 / LMG 26954 / E90) TaxID=1285928 RepID=A0A1G6TDC3_NIADE|nr:hypothetical protein [Niabella drilacis]SDD27029.1 hypothetical protein SAMN04487894_107177 [Niabella drilacis]
MILIDDKMRADIINIRRGGNAGSSFYYLFTLSKVDTVILLKWIKEDHQEMDFLIHPVPGQRSPALHSKELTAKIIDKMEGDGDFYDTLRENNLL